MAWNATYNHENHGQGMRLELDHNMPIIGNPPTRLQLNLLQNQYIVNGHYDGNEQWSATYNRENHEQGMRLELDHNREIIGNPPAHLQLTPLENQYIVNSQ